MPLNIREKLLKTLRKKKITEVQGLPHEITFKVGIKYMITTNVDVQDEFMNGTCGVLKHVIEKEGNVTVVWIQFLGAWPVGLKAKEVYRNFMVLHEIDENLIPIKRSIGVITL